MRAKIAQTVTLREVSFPIFRCRDGGEWYIRQEFERVSGRRVTVVAWGPSREYALREFQREVAEEEAWRGMDPLEDIGNALWPVAAAVDWIVKAVTSFGKEKTS